MAVMGGKGSVAAARGTRRMTSGRSWLFAIGLLISPANAVATDHLGQDLPPPHIQGQCLDGNCSPEQGKEQPACVGVVCKADQRAHWRWLDCPGPGCPHLPSWQACLDTNCALIQSWPDCPGPGCPHQPYEHQQFPWVEAPARLDGYYDFDGSPHLPDYSPDLGRRHYAPSLLKNLPPN